MSQLVSLRRRSHLLADPANQITTLRGVGLQKSFQESLQDSELWPLRPSKIDIFQINLGRVCNQTCAHCHVDAGPDRKEVMSDEVLDRCLEIFEQSSISTIDITGGAPEMHPRFREIISRCGAMPDRKIMHRCNLTAIMTKPMWDIGNLLGENKVEIVASLPSFKEKQTDVQRGDGIFETSIACLRRLNEMGDGKEGTGLNLNLVTNPVGAILPGSQASLEREFKRQLKRRYDIDFNNLFVITNMPISRFLDFLVEGDLLIDYMTRLANAYNPVAAAGVMCRNTISIGYEGNLYDCDFNQMLEVGLDHKTSQTVFDWDLERLERRDIVIDEHCFGCTAGAGSSCGGETS